MATHARQQYFADESSLSKEKREFSIAEEVQQKIDSIEEGAQVNTIETIKVNGSEVQPDENKAVDLTIPGVVDSLDSTSSTDALSARQGKVLYDKITDVSHIGHFLALWDASTGLPVTNPETSPYVYNTGDFYTVSVVAPSGGTNYKPDGTQYVIGQASTTVETDDIAVNDFYFYDGTVWRHMKNSGAGAIAIDDSLSTTSMNPVTNRRVTQAINSKQNALTAGANIQIDPTTNTISATDTTYTAGVGISIANGVISNTQTSAEWGNITGTLADQTDLNTALALKANDANVVHKAGAETITGVKTFTANSGTIDGTPAIIAPRLRIDGQTGSNKFKSQVDFWKGSTKKGYMGYFEENGKNRFEFASEQTSIPFYLGLMPWQANTTKSIAITNDGIWRGGTADTYSADKVFAVIGDLDKRIFSGATAPSNPSEGSLWYDTTNDTLKSYNGTSWKEVGDDAADINTKAFYLNGTTSDLAAAQAAYDWHMSGKTPLLVRGDKVFFVESADPDSAVFYCAKKRGLDHPNGYSTIVEPTIIFEVSDGTVTGIITEDRELLSLLDPTQAYATPFTPTLAGHPATKKYVDDSISAISITPTWGNITGTLSSQTDLQNVLNTKADDNTVVKLTGNQTVAGTKTFSTSPIVPNKTSIVGNYGTRIATEAQVYAVRNEIPSYSEGDGISLANNMISVNIGDGLSIESNKVRINAGDGLSTDINGYIDVNMGDGLSIDGSDRISVNVGDGLSVYGGNSINVNIGDGLSIESNRISVNAGDGLSIDSNGYIDVVADNVFLTQTDYDNLTQTQKANGATYIIIES